MQVTEEKFAVWAGLGSVFLASIVLGCWRVFYPVSDAGLGLLTVLALIIWRGTYLRILTRRTVWRKAIWRPGSVLSLVLTGRFGAHVAGLMAAIVATPTLAHYVLGATPYELAAAAGIVAMAGMIVTCLTSAMTGQLRGPLALPLASTATLWTVGLSGTLALLWVSYTQTPVPEYVGAVSMADTLEAAQANLPQRSHVVADILATIRSVEAAAWCMAKAELTFAGTQFGLIGLLVYNALVAISLTRLACDAVSAAAQIVPEA